jgi:uncharacterized protein YndB with AHSA1/START domain
MSTHLFEIYIRTSAEALWEAITSPEWTVKYGHRAIHRYELRAGGNFVAKANELMRTLGLPETVLDGQVIEAVPPRRLVQTFRFLFTEANRNEGFTRVTWDILPLATGYCQLRLTHEIVEAPLMEQSVTGSFNGHGGGGWSWVLSDLKTLLETGQALTG